MREIPFVISYVSICSVSRQVCSYSLGYIEIYCKSIHTTHHRLGLCDFEFQLHTSILSFNLSKSRPILKKTEMFEAQGVEGPAA